MELSRDFGKEYNKLKTKEELINLLDSYKGILTDFVMEYLYSLIELEFSVIKKYISDKDRELLSELEIYNIIAIFNIYNRALMKLKESNLDLKIFDISNGAHGIYACYPLSGAKNVPVFNYNFSDNKITTGKISVRDRKANIGKISLYSTKENKGLRELEQFCLLKKLNILYSPNISRLPADRIAKEIKESEKRFEELSISKELSENDRKEIEVTKEINRLFLEEYGLTKDSFEELHKEGSPIDSIISYHKTYIKKMPNLTIENNIKYI